MATTKTSKRHIRAALHNSLLCLAAPVASHAALLNYTDIPANVQFCSWSGCGSLNTYDIMPLSVYESENVEAYRYSRYVQSAGSYESGYLVRYTLVDSRTQGHEDIGSLPYSYAISGDVWLSVPEQYDLSRPQQVIFYSGATAADGSPVENLQFTAYTPDPLLTGRAWHYQPGYTGGNYEWANAVGAVYDPDLYEEWGGGGGYLPGGNVQDWVYMPSAVESGGAALFNLLQLSVSSTGHVTFNPDDARNVLVGGAEWCELWGACSNHREMYLRISAVPLPAPALLFGSGLVGLVLTRKHALRIGLGRMGQ